MTFAGDRVVVWYV